MGSLKHRCLFLLLNRKAHSVYQAAGRNMHYLKSNSGCSQTTIQNTFRIDYVNRTISLSKTSNIIKTYYSSTKEVNYLLVLLTNGGNIVWTFNRVFFLFLKFVFHVGIFIANLCHSFGKVFCFHNISKL